MIKPALLRQVGVGDLEDLALVWAAVEELRDAAEGEAAEAALTARDAAAAQSRVAMGVVPAAGAAGAGGAPALGTLPMRNLPASHALAAAPVRCRARDRCGAPGAA